MADTTDGSGGGASLTIDLPQAGQDQQPPSATPVNALNPFDKVVNFLTSDPDLKLSPAAARGAARWMQNVESGLDPQAFNPGGGGQGALGVAQWRGPRQAALLARPDAATLEGQLGHMKSELLGSYSGVLKRLQNTTNENSAYSIWGRDYEGAGLAPGGVVRRTGLGASLELPDFNASLAALTPANNSLAPAPTARREPPALPTVAAQSAPSSLALLSLLAAGTHKVTPVDYDPFSGIPSQDSAGAAMPATPDTTLGSRTSTRPAPSVAISQPYITRTGMRKYYEQNTPGLS